MYFETIPADLQLKIFNYLPFRDRVRLRGVNRLFNEISDRSINTMRSLEINDDLMIYSQMIQPFPSLLESCSPFLVSINIASRSLNQWILNAFTEYAFPKLEHLEIAVTNDELTKKLIRRNRNLRSIVLHLSREFDWPEDIVLEKLECLEIHSSDNVNGRTVYLNLSPTLRPLIGKVPKLERLLIKRERKTAHFIFPIHEFNHLLVGAPCLKDLHLRLFRPDDSPPNGPFDHMCQDFVEAMPYWQLPNLTYLAISLKCPIPSSTLQHFATTSPQLRVLWMGIVTEIDDQVLVALSQLKQLQELALPYLEMNFDMFTRMITLLPSITCLQIKKTDRVSLMALSHLQHLSAFHVYDMEMTRAEIVDVVTNLPSLSILGIWTISDGLSPDAFVDFVTAASAFFHQNLEIRLSSMQIKGNGPELEQMRAVLEEIEKSGGPEVEMDGRDVSTIRYNP